MEGKEGERSERIASKIMRGLAIIGLVAVLTLAAWAAVQGIRMIPNAGPALGSAVSGIVSFFHPAPAEQLSFDIATRTIADGASTTIAWTYTGKTPPESYVFSYACANNVTLAIEDDNGFEPLQCGTGRTELGDSITVRVSSPSTRFADVEIKVAAKDLEDTTLVTIVNTHVGTGTNATSTASAAATNEVPPTVSQEPATPKATATVPTTPATPAVTTPAKPAATTAVTPATVTTPTAPAYIAPADLVVNIKQTGVYVNVAGRDTFFPISPIPSDKRAAVVFTVTNNGGTASGAWAFIAHLPTDGDPTYKYLSPAQDPLAPGMQAEFTLGFDDVQRTANGVITIEIVPVDKTDRPGNNVDAVTVTFK